MTLCEKATYFVAGVLLLLFVGSIGAYHVANTVPSHPRGVANEAVFLWAPAVGFPGGLPRRGRWLSCREDGSHNRCQVWDIDGGSEYEGEFVSYGDKRSLPIEELKIDLNKTGDEAVRIGGEFVPLVFLQNGKVLVPVRNYEDGVRLLQSLEKK